MGRSPCCSKVGLRRGPWSAKEDSLLTHYIQLHGEGKWKSLPKNAGLLRCGKSCRLRWMNYLRPGIIRGNINEDEEDLIIRLHGLLGNRWSLIAGRLPGRTDNEIKNYWNTHLLKKLNTTRIRPIPCKDLPKSRKPDGKPKKTKQKKTENDNNDCEERDANSVKTRLYLPKPIRVSSSSEISRTNSYDQLDSSLTSSSDKVADLEDWSPLFEDFMGSAEYRMPAPMIYCSDDVKMLERVYDEYFQLL